MNKTTTKPTIWQAIKAFSLISMGIMLIAQLIILAGSILFSEYAILGAVFNIGLLYAIVKVTKNDT